MNAVTHAKWTPGAHPLMGWCLDLVVDPRHQLVRISDNIQWDPLTAEFKPFAHFENTNGYPSLRLLVGLYILKQAYEISDDQLIDHWIENPYWQYFCGEEFFRYAFPIPKIILQQWCEIMQRAESERLLKVVIEVKK